MLEWTLHSATPTGPLYYTAPGGWLILHDRAEHAPDRPWKLCRHGVEVERCHTLRIAKLMASGTLQGVRA